MQHDVFAFTYLEHTVKSLQDAANPILFQFRQRFTRLNDDGFAFENRFYFPQVIRFERCAAGYQIANKVGFAKFGCDLNRAGEIDNFRVDRVFA